MAVGLLMAACGNNAERERAQALLDEATAAVEAGQFDKAITLTDSLKNSCPGAIDQRKEALHVATRAREGLNVIELQRADSTVAVLSARIDSLSQFTRFVKNPIEGYYVGKGADAANFTRTTGLQARLTPNGDFYLISSLHGVAIKSTGVAVDGVETARIPYDGERNDRSFGSEVITYMGTECDALGRYIAEHQGQQLILTFLGDREYRTKLTPAQTREIGDLYRLASDMRALRVANIEKERLTRAVDIARSQAARTYVEKKHDEAEAE